MAIAGSIGSGLAKDGGIPVRTQMLPYGRQWLDEADFRAVRQVLESDWLTTGPAVGAFEEAFARQTGAAHAVAVNSGTAALHCAMAALDIGPGDEVIVPSMTFAATANAVAFQGATPVFADVEPDTLLLSPEYVRVCLSPRTKAVVAVDFAGQPCDYSALIGFCSGNSIHVAADACHSLGGALHGCPVGSLAEMTAFSLHPVKPITSGEGGVVTTDDPETAERMRRFRNHGVATDQRRREASGTWFYEMVDLGFNYRITDIQCALALSQLAKLEDFTHRRARLAQRYDRAFRRWPEIRPLATRAHVRHAHHLYVVRLRLDRLIADRNAVFQALRAEGIGANVHYIPVHLHPYYRERFGTGEGLCPNAEAAFRDILTLPLFAGMTDADCDDVIEAVRKVVTAYRR